MIWLILALWPVSWIASGLVIGIWSPYSDRPSLPRAAFIVALGPAALLFAAAMATFQTSIELGERIGGKR